MSENNKRDRVTNCTRPFLSCTVVDNVLSDKEAHYRTLMISQSPSRSSLGFLQHGGELNDLHLTSIITHYHRILDHMNLIHKRGLVQ